MKCVVDKDSLVQEVACASAANLMEDLPEKLLLYAYDILQVFVSVIEAHKGPALAGLYDAIGKLVEGVFLEKIRGDERALNMMVLQIFFLCI